MTSRGILRGAALEQCPRLTKILVFGYGEGMSWTVNLKESVIDDLRWFGKKEGIRGHLLREATLRLEADPLAENRNLNRCGPTRSPSTASYAYSGNSNT